MFGMLVAWCAALPGCGTTAAEYDYELNVPARTELLAVDIENFRGSVEVRTDGEPGMVRVSSRVVAGSGASETQVEAVEEGTGIEARIEEIDGRGVLKIRTAPAEARGAEEVRLFVEVPRCDGVRILNRGGDVEVVGAGGAMHIENHQGAIEVRTARVMDQDVLLLGVDGNIYYQVPPGSSGVFNLETLEGEVAMRDFSGKSEETYSRRTYLETTLNNGPNRVTARTNRGNVRVWVMEDPEALTRIYKRSLPDAEDYIFQQGSRRFTRNLPDDEPRRRGTRSNPGGSGG